MEKSAQTSAAEVRNKGPVTISTPFNTVLEALDGAIMQEKEINKIK